VLGAWRHASTGILRGGLHVIGVTGTNGKTTITYIIESILRAAGQSAGVVGTIAYRYNGQMHRAQTTTPESTEIQRLFAEMKAAGTKYVAMEVSSHALDQARVEGIEFDGAIFANLTHDHLDYHGDFDHYKEARSACFTCICRRAPRNNVTRSSMWMTR